MPIIFEKSVSGRTGVSLPPVRCAGAPCDRGKVSAAQRMRRLPELSELDVVRHFTALSRMNFGVDTNFYPLGSCTMKYNPKITEKIAALRGFAALHPLLPQLSRGGMLTQGALAVVYELEQAALRDHGHGRVHGAAPGRRARRTHGHDDHRGLPSRQGQPQDRNPDPGRGARHQSVKRRHCRVHGTVGADRSRNRRARSRDARRDARREDRGDHADQSRTRSASSTRISKKSRPCAHRYDAQLYYDGANFNAILGKFRPGDADFDVVHVNLHKTFATPARRRRSGRGSGGRQESISNRTCRYRASSNGRTAPMRSIIDYPKSIGYIAPFYGNFGICLRAYAYILMQGAEGLSR